MSNRKSPLEKKPFNTYIKYSALAFQMLATILIGLGIGWWLDRHFEKENSIFTVIFTFVFVVFSLVMVIRQIIKEN